RHELRASRQTWDAYLLRACPASAAGRNRRDRIPRALPVRRSRLDGRAGLDHAAGCRGPRHHFRAGLARALAGGSRTAVTPGALAYEPVLAIFPVIRPTGRDYGIAAATSLRISSMAMSTCSKRWLPPSI